MVNIRNKGQRGEREAIDMVTSWCHPVTESLGLPPVVLERNLQQSREGGYDVIGLDWLALEVKRHENLQVSTWWKQTLRQVKPGQLPFLMYRQNRTPWRFRLIIHGRNGCQPTVDCDLENAKLWLQYELYARLSV